MLFSLAQEVVGFDLMRFFTQFGFPAVVAMIAMQWTAKRIERSEDQSAKREENMANRIRTLEDRFETELIDLVHQQGDIIKETKEVINDCKTVMQGCETALTRMFPPKEKG